jgi:hypothetical protein
MKKNNRGGNKGHKKRNHRPIVVNNDRQKAAKTYLDDLYRDLGLTRSTKKPQSYEDVSGYIERRASGFMSQAGSKLPHHRVPDRKQIKDVVRTYVSKNYQDGQLDLLKQTVGLLTDALKGLNLPIPSQPLYGQLPLGSLNAMSIRVPGTADSLIVFHEGVFEFLHFYVRILASALTIPQISGRAVAMIDGKDQIVETIARRTDAQTAMIDAIDHYLFAGSAVKARAATLGFEASLITSILLSSSEIFVLGHEWGHLEKGHHANAATVSRSIGPRDVVADAPEVEQEYEADERGVWYSTRWVIFAESTGNFQRFFYVGGAVALSAMYVAERALSIIATGREADLARISHPSPRQRFERIYHLSEISKNYGATKIADDIWAAGEAFLDVYRPVAARHFEEGQEVHRMWKPLVDRFIAHSIAS